MVQPINLGKRREFVCHKVNDIQPYNHTTHTVMEPWLSKTKLAPVAMHQRL